MLHIMDVVLLNRIVDVLSDVLSWPGWVAMSALGTLAAASVAAWVAVRDIRRHRASMTKEERRAANLVSAWVEVDYLRNVEKGRFIRKITLFVSNEGDQPVYDVVIRVGVAQGQINLGPLGAPDPISVLAPRTRRSWDVSLGILAHESKHDYLPTEPVTRLSFTDSGDTRWVREFNSPLKRQGDSRLGRSTASRPTEIPDEQVDSQLGDSNSIFNPWMVASTFLNVIRSGSEDEFQRIIPKLVSQDAENWSNFSWEDVLEIRENISEYVVGTYISYRADNIAYLQLWHPDDLAAKSDKQGYVSVEKLQYMTLVFYAGRGWKVFSFGHAVSAPHRINFPPGTLAEDPFESG